MNIKMKAFILIIVIVIFICVSSVVYHEQVHGAVCNAVNGIESYGFNWDAAYTICRGKVLHEPMSDFTKYNLINEIVGYNLSIILIVIILYPFYLKGIKLIEK